MLISVTVKRLIGTVFMSICPTLPPAAVNKLLRDQQGEYTGLGCLQKYSHPRCRFLFLLSMPLGAVGERLGQLTLELVDLCL